DELTITPVDIASGGEMSRIEICGSDMVDLGEVRHYLADITDVGIQIFTTNGRVLNGDSGGPWLSDGKLVGVSSTGSQPIARSNRGRQIFNMSVSTNTQSVQDFVKRMHDGHCLEPT
ncbi:MAG TPA: trypsin-like serine protease, partial [Pirellulales bacterium]|nr:trypsin-like serine protease [Pirellulales bacterium]